MIGTITATCKDGSRAMRIWGKSLDLSALTTLAAGLQAYTNAHLSAVTLWEPQTLSGMHAATTEEFWDSCKTKAVMTMRRTNAPAGRPYMSRIQWPAPKSTLFEQVSGIGPNKSGYRNKSTYGASIIGILQDESNRTYRFEKGWLKKRK